jgi:hypothetical protein
MSLIPEAGPKTQAARRNTRLAEPIECGKFWANRRGEACVVSIREHEGIVIVDARRFYTAGDGTLKPTRKGISLTVRRLPDLAAAIGKALAKARELKLIEDAS